MLKTFLLSLKIDYVSAINTFLYSFQKIKFLDKLFHPLYQKKGFKVFLSILASILTLFSSVFSSAIYLFFIYIISSYVSKDSLSDTFIHIYFTFTIIGMFINTGLLNIGYKHYTNICLLSMDAKKYVVSHLLYDNIVHFFIHLVLLSLLIPNLSGDLLFIILLSVFSFLSKIVGEMINLAYYEKKKTRITENYAIYFFVVLSFLVVAFLPYFSILFPKEFYLFTTFVTFFLFLYSSYYLFSYPSYQNLVKEILFSRVLSTNHSFSTRDLVEISNQDKEIKENKVSNKTGYDRFHTIFLERHKSILFNSAIQISILVLVVGVIGMIYIGNHQEMIEKVPIFFKNHVSMLILLMYFINRGGVITHAMFMNCDHAMLRYHFYRTPEVITSLYQKRIKTVMLINWLPALVIGILLVLYGYFFADFSFFYLACLFLSVFILSMFFSIYYVATYYLLQPYSGECRMVSFSYSFLHLITCLICFTLLKVTIPVSMLLIGISILTFLFIVISKNLIKNRACYTFRLK